MIAVILLILLPLFFWFMLAGYYWAAAALGALCLGLIGYRGWLFWQHRALPTPLEEYEAAQTVATDTHTAYAVPPMSAPGGSKYLSEQDWIRDTLADLEKWKDIPEMDAKTLQYLQVYYFQRLQDLGAAAMRASAPAADTQHATDDDFVAAAGGGLYRPLAAGRLGGVAGLLAHMGEYAVIIGLYFVAALLYSIGLPWVLSVALLFVAAGVAVFSRAQFTWPYAPLVLLALLGLPLAGLCLHAGVILPQSAAEPHLWLAGQALLAAAVCWWAAGVLPSLPALVAGVAWPVAVGLAALAALQAAGIGLGLGALALLVALWVALHSPWMWRQLRVRHGVGGWAVVAVFPLLAVAAVAGLILAPDVDFLGLFTTGVAVLLGLAGAWYFAGVAA